MKKISVASLVLVVGLFLLFPSFSFAQKTQTNSTWKTFTSEELGFTVSMPTQPEITKGNYITALGNRSSISDDTILSKVRGGSFLYFVNVFAVCPLDVNNNQEALQEILSRCE